MDAMYLKSSHADREVLDQRADLTISLGGKCPASETVRLITVVQQAVQDECTACGSEQRNEIIEFFQVAGVDLVSCRSTTEHRA